MGPVDAPELLDLFDRLVAETALALADLEDWGPSGERPSQYRHDVVADDIIVGGLRAAGLGVLSEESGSTGEHQVTVVVDPVDGSTNGSRGLPWFAASLCAVDAAGPLAALVVNLGTGLRYRAVRGGGARRDHSPIRVDRTTRVSPSAISAPAALAPPPDGIELGASFELAEPIRAGSCRDLGDAIVGFSGLPPSHGGWRQFRAMGAAALDLCAVADGTLDGYVDVDRAHGVWDYLGALLVCREAGAAIVDADGDDLVVLDHAARRAPVAGATPTLTEQLVAMAAGWS